MSEMSEDALCAEWDQDTHSSLWLALHTAGTSQWYHRAVTAEDKAHLSKLAREAGGWCMWSHEEADQGVVLVPWPEWDAVCRENGWPVGLPEGV